jgi:hypothetical protein
MTFILWNVKHNVSYVEFFLRREYRSALNPKKYVKSCLPIQEAASLSFILKINKIVRSPNNYVLY